MSKRQSVSDTTSYIDENGAFKYVRIENAVENPNPMFVNALENVVYQATRLMDNYDVLDLDNNSYSNQISPDSWYRLFVPMPMHEGVMKPKVLGKPVEIEPSVFRSELLALVEQVEQQTNLNDDLAGLFNPGELLPDIPPNDRFYLSDDFKEDAKQRARDEKIAAELEGRPVRVELDFFPIVGEAPAQAQAPDITMSLLSQFQLPTPPALKSTMGINNQTTLNTTIIEAPGTSRRRESKATPQSHHTGTPPSNQHPGVRLGRLTHVVKNDSPEPRTLNSLNDTFNISAKKTPSPVKPTVLSPRKSTSKLPKVNRSQAAIPKPTSSRPQKPGQIARKQTATRQHPPHKTDSKPTVTTGAITKRFQSKPTVATRTTAKEIVSGLSVKNAAKITNKTGIPTKITVPLAKTTAPSKVKCIDPVVSEPKQRGRPPGSPNKTTANSPTKTSAKNLSKVPTKDSARAPVRTTVKATVRATGKPTGRTPVRAQAKASIKASAKTVQKIVGKPSTKPPAKTPSKTSKK